MLSRLRTPALLLGLLGVLAPAGCDGIPERPAAGSSAAPRVFFVAPNGRNSNRGTRRRPLRTLAHALKRLRAGDRLYVRGGSYTERISVHAAPGRRGARIVVSSFPGERPVVRGKLWLYSPSYWTIRGIDVTRSGRMPTNLVRVSGGTRWVWERSEIWNPRAQAGFLIDDGVDDNRPLGRFTLRRNCIRDTVPNAGRGQDHNIYVSDFNGSPKANGLIERNIVLNATNGRGIKFGPGDGTGGPHHVLARFNTIYNSFQNISVSFGSHDITLERNLLIRADEGNIASWMLRGTQNVARENAGGEAPSVLRSRGRSRRPVMDGGGNRRLNTAFDALTCSGFHPANEAARAYGRYASGRVN